MVVHQAGVPADLGPIRDAVRPLGHRDRRGRRLRARQHLEAVARWGSTPTWPCSRSTRARSSPPARAAWSSPSNPDLAAPPAAAPRARHEPQRLRSPHERRPGPRVVPRARLQLPHDRPAGRDRPGPARAARPDRGRATRAGPSLPRAALLSVPGLQVVDDPPYGTTNFQSFWVVLPDDFPESRDEVLGAARPRAGVSARRGIMASHLEPAYATRVAGQPPGDRAPDPPVADPAALPRPHRRRSGSRGLGASVRRRPLSPIGRVVTMAAPAAPPPRSSTSRSSISPPSTVRSRRSYLPDSTG